MPFQRPRGTRAGGMVGVALTGTSADGHARVSLGRSEKARHRPARRPRSRLARRRRSGWPKSAVWEGSKAPSGLIREFDVGDSGRRVGARGPQTTRAMPQGRREFAIRFERTTAAQFGRTAAVRFKWTAAVQLGRTAAVRFKWTAAVQLGRAARLVRESSTRGRMTLVRMA